ncbi:YggS family pyridoxal phosphate-dependent enzyme [Georgenia satyanarayanai]|uniref:YggS family pyridoxal phosphate-dependent enzyme n=1 Tax=Georgenia satyanarayanai TaxID=860221 RepID=UPI00203EF22A|nr:YggS family pyridoxal phosphate-dependent enzyme [Georgenia satyanarayanai]MCM3661675.1 YggS family pyridoxal phosphate-dependent enzyme [Georgenia satyanarayanai]
MSEVLEALVAVRDRVARAARVVGRDPEEVQLLLAVKTLPVDRVREAIGAGAHLLGHNRAQELVATAPELAGLPHEMHFIGRLQSNKAGKVVPLVSCVQSVDSLALAERLDRLAAREGRRLDVFAQVNTSGEETKAGAAPQDAVAHALAVAALPHLRLRGLMTIGARSEDVDVVRASYERLAALRDEVVASGAPGTAEARELSMGMSTDLELAVAAGATMVRVGTAVFGARPTG